MRNVTLTRTVEKDFLAGSDGAFYTPVEGVEAKCQWCGKWGHTVGLFHRERLYVRRTVLICHRHVFLGDETQTA
jgi:hypothetical protein